MENEERPHDYQAEEAILCAILHDNTALDSLTLEPADFCDPQNGAIYQGDARITEQGPGNRRGDAVRFGATPGRYPNDGQQAGRAAG